jgi:hypothetical protein
MKPRIACYFERWAATTRGASFLLSQSTIPPMSKFLALSVAMLLATASAAAQPDQYSYRDFVKYANTSKADTQLHAFLQGIAYTIRNDYVCDDKDSENLRNPAAIVDELLHFATTDWGKFYLEYEGSFGVMRYPMTVGDVMLKFYTQHSRCKRLPRVKEQFAR